MTTKKNYNDKAVILPIDMGGRDVQETHELVYEIVAKINKTRKPIIEKNAS